MTHLKPAPVHEPPEDLRHHERTYAGFVHVGRWFVIHIGLILVGVYFALMQDNMSIGFTFIAAAVAALFYGIVSVGRARDQWAPVDEQDRDRPPQEAPIEPPVSGAAEALGAR